MGPRKSSPRSNMYTKGLFKIDAEEGKQGEEEDAVGEEKQFEMGERQYHTVTVSQIHRPYK